MHHHARFGRAFDVLFNHLERILALLRTHTVSLLQGDSASHIEGNLHQLLV